MKKLIVSLFTVAGLMLSYSTFAADEAKTEAKAGKEVTLKGEAKCAKCALHESDKCQNVLEVTGKNGKKTTYTLTGDASKAFHETVCKAPKEVTVTGVKGKKGENGKMDFAVTKIEEAK